VSLRIPAFRLASLDHRDRVENRLRSCWVARWSRKQFEVIAETSQFAPNVAPNFQARHLDFHPSGPWVFVTIEGQNKLAVFERNKDGMLGATPLFLKDTQLKPNTPGATASIHVHPDGRFVYLSNRGRGTEGENSIAVFQINPNTGEPTRIQNADTRGLSPRTFGLDPSGRLLVVANESPGIIREGANTRESPASLTVFRIGKDGRLEYLRKYDVTMDKYADLFWMALVPLR
jgi:6-phosphogluconolactonase